MTNPVETIKQVCELLSSYRDEDAKNILEEQYKFSSVKSAKRAYTPKQSMKVFVRDGFIDRYSGLPLVFPGTLKLISELLPAEFPYQLHWKTSETHIAFWELLPTIDHVVPVTRGGKDEEDNWVSTSQLRNSAKSNSLLEELGWHKFPEGDISYWDGLTLWFLEYVDRNNVHHDPYISKWYKAANPYREVLTARNRGDK